MGRKLALEGRNEEILNLKSEGFQAKEIARRLGVTYGAIRHHSAIHGIDWPKNTSPLDREIPALVAQGLTREQIGEALGVTASAIDRRCKVLGLRTGRTGPRAADGHRDWEGGRRLEKHGYIGIYAPLHPQSRTGTASISEHRAVMEVVLCRYLLRQEVVDHGDDTPYHN